MTNYKHIASALLLICGGNLLVSAQTETVKAVKAETTDSIDTEYTELDEFVLTTKKDIVKSDGATLTYDLEQDDTSKGMSVLDALRKVPMVSVDGQDKIRVKGDTNFKIYVNGKEEPMLTANAATVLKAMPAESVSKIEVITEPGAKYDAEGTAGIINLVTERKQRKDGYAGSVSGNMSTANEGLSLYGRVKYNRVTAEANVNYSDNLLMKRTSFTRQETYNRTSEDSYYGLQHFTQRYGFNYIGGNLNLSWEPTDIDLFTISANVYSMDANLDRLTTQNSYFNRAGQLTQSFAQNANGDLRHLGANGSASYRHSFGNSGRNLTTAYAFNFGRQSLDLNYANERTMNGDVTNDFERNQTYTYTREHTATIDYTNPISDNKHLLETGAKGVFRRNTANSGQYFGLTPDNLTPNPANISLNQQLQDIYAAYVSYTGTFGHLSAKAGLRYEHTYMGMDFRIGEGSNYRRHLNDLVPNAALTWMFGPSSNLRLAYQMRITRPSLSQMNPFRFQLVQNEVRMGNPDLESERYNNVTLTYSNFGPALGGNIALEASQSNNTIEDYNYFEDNIHYETYANMGHKQRIGLNGFLNWNILQNLTFSVNGSLHYTIIKSGSGNLENHGWNGSYGANFSYTGPAKIKFSGYGGQSTGEINLQGAWKGWYYYGIGISRSFLKDDALKLSLNASNFLTKNTFFRSELHTKDYSQYSLSKNPSWSVGVSVTWNFGHLSDRVKQTGANLENNDTKSASKGGGGGIGL